ncbi:MAG: NAD(P)H-hydrate dehydratase [candidate division WOR-3 bacterium]
MRKVFSFEDTKVFDRIAEERGYSLETLMEIAGKGVYEAIKSRFDLKGLRVVVVCGKGNNGGDGLVCARYLSLSGASVKVYIPSGELSHLSKIQLERLKGLCEIVLYSDEMLYDIVKADVVVDAVFGVGFSGDLKGDYRRVIGAINEGKFVVSVDVPSGVSGDGSVGDLCVRADLTVCMGALKEAVLLFPGRVFAGEVVVVNLGVPFPAGIGSFLIEESDIREFIPKPLGNEHKGKFGRLVVFAGSKKYPGALNLTLLGALRGGVGLIYALNLENLTILYPEVIPLNSLNFPFKPSAFAIGPGLSGDENMLKTAYKLISDYPDVPVVLDADGLKLIKDFPHILDRENLIITPHPGEFSKFFGGKPDEIDKNRIKIAKEFSRNHACVLVLKGNPTVVGHKGDVYINPTGNVSLAKGGSGDVLTGLIGSLLAQGIKPLESALSGVFIHGKAADLLDNRSYRITEIADKIPEVFKNVLLQPSNSA